MQLLYAFQCLVSHDEVRSDAQRTNLVQLVIDLSGSRNWWSLVVKIVKVTIPKFAKKFEPLNPWGLGKHSSLNVGNVNSRI